MGRRTMVKLKMWKMNSSILIREGIVTLIFKEFSSILHHKSVS